MRRKDNVINVYSNKNKRQQKEQKRFGQIKLNAKQQQQKIYIKKFSSNIQISVRDKATANHQHELNIASII